MLCACFSGSLSRLLWLGNRSIKDGGLFAKQLELLVSSNIRCYTADKAQLGQNSCIYMQLHRQISTLTSPEIKEVSKCYTCDGSLSCSPQGEDFPELKKDPEMASSFLVTLLLQPSTVASFLSLFPSNRSQPTCYLRTPSCT